eukprot:2865388-Amphidinium_carterae.1
MRKRRCPLDHPQTKHDKPRLSDELPNNVQDLQDRLLDSSMSKESLTGMKICGSVEMFKTVWVRGPMFKYSPTGLNI